MDQCEDREVGVPPSKSTLCGEHESQTKAQRNPPGPPPSSVSLQSDESKGVGSSPSARSEMEESVEEQLLHMLDDLGEKELKRFHFYLEKGPGGDFRTIKKRRLEKADREETVDVMVQAYSDRVMEVAVLILKKMKGSPSAQEASLHLSEGGFPQALALAYLWNILHLLLHQTVTYAGTILQLQAKHD